MCFLKHIILILNVSYIKFGESTEVKSQLAKERKRKEAHVSQRASLQPPDSQEALASLRSLSPGRSAVPHTNRGEGAVGIRGRQKCQLPTLMDEHLHLHDPFHEFPSWGRLSPKTQCSAESRDQQPPRKNEGQLLSFHPSNSLLTATHVPGAQIRGAGGRRRKTQRQTLPHREVQSSAGPAQPWEQTCGPAPSLAQGSAQASTPSLSVHLTLGRLQAPQGPDSAFVRQGHWSPGVPPSWDNHEDYITCLRQLVQSQTERVLYGC